MRVAAFLLLITTASFGSAAAGVHSIDIEPADPVVGDSVAVVACGNMADTCWSVTESIWVWISEDSLAVDIYTYDCLFRECDGCSDMVIDYERSLSFVVQAAGCYTVTATEHRDSEWWPGENHIIMDFNVGDETPAVESSWGRIKQLYR